MPNYIAITPFKDEEKYLPNLIRSFINLSCKPLIWYLVDDGSEDSSRQIIESYSSQLSWVKILSMPKRQNRLRGKAVVNAIMKAYEEAININYDFIVKIDADITFNENLFLLLLSKMIDNPHIGICGPELVILREGKWQIDRVLPKNIVRGAVRIYRKECFKSIDGLIPKKGWDGIDQIKAKVLGWEVERFSNIIAYNHREQGDATGVIKSAIENGRGSYFMGSLFSYMLHEAFNYGKQKPYLIRGIFMIVGYFIGFLLRDKIKDKRVIAYLKNQNIE